MGIKCCGCKEKIKFYQKTGGNSCWHLHCWNCWQDGYNTAIKYAEDMCNRFNLPLPHEIYLATQIVYNKNAYENAINKIKESYNKWCRKKFKENIILN